MSTTSLLDKNGVEIKPGQLVRLCRNYADYLNPNTQHIQSLHGVLYIGSEPISQYRNGDTQYHSVEVVG